MRAAWLLAALTGSLHGSGHGPEPRPLGAQHIAIHCATTALATDNTHVVQSTMPKSSEPNAPTFPPGFILWDMKKVTKMKWLLELVDVLPQVDASIRILACRGIAIERSKIVTSKDRHIQDLERGMATEYTCERPAPIEYLPKKPPTDPAALTVYNALAAVTAPDVTTLTDRYTVNSTVLLAAAPQ